MADNADLVRRGFEAFAAGDMAALDELIADDVVWVSEGDNILAGRFEGKEAVFGQWARLPAETEGTFRQEVTELFADDHVVVALANVSASRRGKSLDGVRQAIVFVIRDGQVSQGRVLVADQALSDDFWAA